MNNDKYKDATCISHMQIESCEMTGFVPYGRKKAVWYTALYDTARWREQLSVNLLTLCELFVTESLPFVIS